MKRIDLIRTIEQSGCMLVRHGAKNKWGQTRLSIIRCSAFRPFLSRRMARLPRYFVPGQPQHVILRSNNRQVIFAYRQLFRSSMPEADLQAIRDSTHKG